MHIEREFSFVETESTTAQKGCRQGRQVVARSRYVYTQTLNRDRHNAQATRLSPAGCSSKQSETATESKVSDQITSHTSSRYFPILLLVENR